MTPVAVNWQNVLGILGLGDPQHDTVVDLSMECFQSALVPQAALVQDTNVRSYLLNLRQEVARQEDGDPVGPWQITYQLSNLPDPGRIQTIRGLIQDQKIRITKQREGQTQTLLHAQRIGPYLAIR